MMRQYAFGALVALAICAGTGSATADGLRIVSWNASPTFAEGLASRLSDFTALDDALSPDVLVLVETAGGHEVQMIAEALGWDEFYGISSDWSVARQNVFFALEAAVISKIPIEAVIEYDASPDTNHEVFSHDGAMPGRVQEMELSADGIPGFGQTLAATDRGTLRVDLANGLSVFPLHLKSNRNAACFDLGDTLSFLRQNGFPVDPALIDAEQNGFPAAAKGHVSNAIKRERVMAATARIAAATMAEGRIPIIAGDLNTSFEPGKYGTAVEDCTVQPFSCEAGPFPAAMCSGGDGFDDTLGMLTAGLVDDQAWAVLTEGLGKTYDSDEFSDLAIDHFAVPVEAADRFTTATKVEQVFGSDHFPILTIFSE